jgi:hypothetical protein
MPELLVASLNKQQTQAVEQIGVAVTLCTRILEVSSSSFVQVSSVS